MNDSITIDCNKKNKRFFLYYTLMAYNALISLLYIIFNYQVGIIYLFFSLSIFILILLKNTQNIIFFIRTFFLGIIGFIAIGAKMISNDALFGYHMRESQSLEIATLMFLLTNIALFGSEIGFLTTKKIKIERKSTFIFEGKLFFYIVFLLLFIVSYLISMQSQSILVAAYGSNAGIQMPVNNLNSISNILFYTLIFLYFKYINFYNWKINKYKYLLIFSAVYLYIYSEILHGVRMDALNGVFGSIVLYYIYTNKSLKLTWKVFLLGIFLFILLQIVGIVRSALQFMTFSQLIDLVIYGLGSIFTGSKSGIMFYQGTINDIATTFSGIIYMLKHNIVGFLYGSSYFDYILRTPPQFLYPDRPQDLAWIFINHGFSSGGGFFELAEAYYNFGIIGAFIVPFSVSFILGYSYKLFIINRYSLVSSILLFSILSGFMRGVLYQTFTFYKSIVTGFILLVMFYFIIGMIQKNKHKALSK